MVFGWTTCLTYQTGARALGYDHFGHLVDEMADHGMSFLIVMMASHGAFSPGNHGLAWPVANPRLKPQLDRHALNANEATEFFSRFVDRAHRRGVRVIAEIKYLGMNGIRQGYPGVEFRTRPDGSRAHKLDRGVDDSEREAIETLPICCDSAAAHLYMRDKVRDLLTRYPDLDGIVLEHPSYSRETCHCSSSKRRLLRDTGKTWDELAPEEWLVWKSARVRDTLLDLKNLATGLSARLSFGFYSGVPAVDGDVAGYQDARGHRTEQLAEVGLDFVMPYCEGRNGEREPAMIERVMGQLAPLEAVLHTAIRKVMPRYYDLPPKDPEYVRRIVRWARDYARNYPRLLGMSFFNEVSIPAENRRAVYESIGK